MRLVRVRRAVIDRDLRTTFEWYGLGTMQHLLASGGRFRHINGNLINVSIVENELLSWLIEQYDRAERKENWTLTLEVMVTIFVGLELLHSIAWVDVLHSIIRFVRWTVNCKYWL